MQPVEFTGHAGLILAAPQTLAEIEKYALERGMNLSAVRDQGRLVMADASQWLQRCMLNDQPDPARFNDLVAGTLLMLGYGQRKVHVYAETAALLCAQGLFEEAVRIEHVWNALAASHRFDLLCGFPIDLFNHADHATDVERIRQAHTYTVRR